MKKIKLRDVGNDKIFREVSALSRLNHRFIVRYYTTWVETSNALPSNLGSESGDSGQTDDTHGRTSMPRRRGGSSSDDDDDDDEDGGRVSRSMSGGGGGAGFNGHFTTFDIKDLDSLSTSRHSTFPSIHFARSNSQQNDDDNDNDNDNGSSSDDGLFEADEESRDGDGDGDDPFGWTDGRGRTRPIPMSGSAFLRKSLSPPAPRKMLYIQMVSVFRRGCTLWSWELICHRNSSSDKRCARYVKGCARICSSGRAEVTGVAYR